MRHVKLVVVVVVAVLGSLVAVWAKTDPRPAARGSTVAVVIGVDRIEPDYDKPRDSAAHQAVTLAGLLREPTYSATAPFNVLLLTSDSPASLQPTSPRIRQTIRQAAAATRPDDTLLVYFAGRSVLTAQGPRLETSETSTNPNDIPALSVRHLYDALADAPAGQILLILDAGLPGPAKLQLPTDSRVALWLARGAGEAATNNELPRGVFSWSLLRELQAAAGQRIALSELARRVAAGMAEWGRQHRPVPAPNLLAPEQFELDFTHGNGGKRPQADLPPTVASTINTLRAEADARFNRAFTHRRNNRREAAFAEYARAVSSYRSVLALDPDDFTANYRLAYIFQCRGAFDEAERRYRKAMQCDPDYTDAYRGVGDAIYLEQRFAEVDMSVAIDPENEMFAGLMYDLQDHDWAEERYLEAIAYEPKAWALFSLGEYLYKLERHGEAEALYRAVLHRNPNAVWAHYKLGKFRADRGRFDLAEEALRHVIAQDPTQAWPYTCLGDIIRHVLETDTSARLDRQAATLFRQAIERDPRQAWPYCGLGESLERLEKPAEAVAAYRQAVQRDPKLIPAVLALARLEGRR